MILLDDWGWGNAAWHNNASTSGNLEIQTPRMNELVNAGIELDHHYTYKFCAPSRSALQSGRNPIHVNVLNQGAHVTNPNDKVSGYTGIPRDMTGIGTVLQ